MPSRPLTSGVPAEEWCPWLMLVLQLPTARSNQRVKTWRRLQQVGAIAVKNAVYVLPHTAQSREDFEWVRAEVAAAGGEASVFAARAVEGLTDGEIGDLFRRARADDYAALLKPIVAAQRKAARSGARDEELGRAARHLRERVSRVEAIDFFDAPGRQEIEKALTALEASLHRSRQTRVVKAGPRTPLNRADYHDRKWVTRPRPGVDRFASAWLISRFVDPAASFVFASSPEDAPEAIPFDMFGGGFGHEGDRCTFEVLTSVFAVHDPVVARIGEIVHDLDLNDERFRPSQAAGVQAIVEGMQSRFADDHALLAHGVGLFEALYRGLQPARPSGRPPKAPRGLSDH